ncbi:Heparinase II/III-like protein [Opitutaceae bacterium TAV1]|nr:Heparinase II/III-like protein [Opitutaceae bacterium TAV1]
MSPNRTARSARLLLALALLVPALIQPLLAQSQTQSPTRQETAQERLDKNLPDFPKPDPVDAFRDQKIFDTAGRFYRVPREDWTAAIARTRTDPAWKTWLDARRATLDDWMQTRFDRPDWKAGWGHHFVSPKNGSYLTFTPDEPGPHTTLSSPSDPHVALTPAIHAAWVTKFRQMHMEQVLEAARFYRLTRDRKYLDWAAAQFDFYARHYAEIQPFNAGIRPGKLFGNLLNDAITLVTMTQAARLIHDDIDAARKTYWRDNYFYPEVRLLDRGFPCPINISCWQRSAQGLVALLHADAALLKEVIDGPQGIRRQLARGVTSDYIWFEQSLGYNYYVVEGLVPFFEEAARQGRMDGLLAEAAILQNLMLAPLQLRFPNGYLPNPSDVTGRLPVSRVKERMAAAAHVLPTAPGLEKSANIRSWSNLLDPLTDLPPRVALPAVASRSLESTRFLVLKHGLWQLFAHFGQNDASHAQSEALSFEAAYGTLPLTLDPGTVPYASPLYKNYYKAGLADNVPLIAGQPQSTWRRGQLLAFDAQQNRALIAQKPFVPGWDATREFLIDGDRLIDRLTLSPTQSENRALPLGFLLHFEEPVNLSPETSANFNPVQNFAAGRREGFKNWSVVTRADAVDETRFRLQAATVSGVQLFDLIIRTEGPFRIHLGTTPGYPPARRTSLLVEKNATTATFETIFIPVSSR